MTTPNSWWAVQKPYQEPSINRSTTHAVAPVFNGFEIPKLNDQFDPGQLVYFTAWYHDQLLNAPTSFLVKDPQGTVIFSWNHPSPASYLFSYWYWIFVLPQNAVEGEWTFQATFDGEIRTHQFQVGEVNASHSPEGGNLTISPNPVMSDLHIGIRDLQI